MAIRGFVTPSVEDLTVCYVRGHYFDGKIADSAPGRAAPRASFTTPSVENLTQCYVNGRYFDGKKRPAVEAGAPRIQGAAPACGRKRSSATYSDGVRRVRLPLLPRSETSGPACSEPGSPRGGEHEVSFYLDLASPVSNGD